MAKLQVRREVAEALDKLGKDEWSKQFDLIAHCKGFTGNGYPMGMGDIYTEELRVLQELSPLEFARYVTEGYEIEQTSRLNGNHMCIDAKCRYSTDLIFPSEAEANEKLLLDGGLNEKKNTRCPKCKQDTIQYLPKKNN